jgi:putative ABC transport system ATP-binding protein
MTETQPLIRLSGVTKVFYAEDIETHALSGVHLEIAKGEYISIAGPSGCGKSTLLSILGLLDSPSQGEYSLDGTEVAGLTASDRARIRNRQVGFIFQSFNLVDDLTVYENVELPLTYRPGGVPDRRKKVRDALERVAMSHRMKHYPAQLSGGQQQPTGNLDSKNGESVMNLMRELNREGATICMVTHDPRYARHADRSIHLFDGRVVEETRLPYAEQEIRQSGFELQ